MRTLFTVVFLSLLIALSVCSAATVTGSVVDQSTGEPVANASVIVSTVSFGASTGADGQFTLLGVPDGAFTMTVSHVSYWPETFNLNTDQTTVIGVELRPKAYLGEDVTLTIDRVERKTATVPFTNITADELDLRYYAQDLPVALEGIPSLTTSTDAGNALGYSYLSLRGFDFKRVSVLLNGVMLNDPEDFYVYWVDLADFGANVEDVQVQRGAGSALLGLPAVGGTIDVQTSTFSRKPALTAEYGLGSYNTQRGSVNLQSGPIGEKYFLNARFSRITSDGYRDDSWADYFSYYLSGARVDESMTTRFVLFGGPIRNGMAYSGVTREQLAQDRTQNPLSYPELGNYDETDNYYQPHYQLHNTWEINDNVRLQNTLFYIQGNGYFDVYYPAWWGYGWDFWSLDAPDSLAIGDMVARQHVNNNQGGWQPRMTWRTGGHTVDVGGQFISHRSRRYGELLWGSVLPDGTTPNHNWYDYEGRKRIISGYVQDKWQLTPQLSLTGAVQLANIEYEVLNDKFNGKSFTQPYTFVMPRVGASYLATDQIRLWGSYSRITREPRLKDHYWAETGYPVIRYPNNNFNRDPQIKPETLDDFELGAEWSQRNWFLGVTGYLMNVEDEIVDIGQYDVLGQPVIENACRTQRVGVELASRYQWDNGLFAEGNATLSRNRFLDYTTDVLFYDNASFTTLVAELDLSDKQIINAPEQLFNFAFGVRRAWYDFRVSAHYVGERFVANTEDLIEPERNFTNATSLDIADQDRSLDAYTRVDLQARLAVIGPNGSRALFNYASAPSVELSLHVRNLFDEEYNIAGSADAWGVYVIPAAPRHYFAGIKVTL
ncbi:TonB-dependent receptor [bacterium]|nr:TonB-dependent receptor [bacterium]